MTPTPRFVPQSGDDARINNRRSFLRLTVGAVVGAAAMPVLGQPEKSIVPSAEMFKDFKIDGTKLWAYVLRQ